MDLFTCSGDTPIFVVSDCPKEVAADAEPLGIVYLPRHRPRIVVADPARPGVGVSRRRHFVVHHRRACVLVERHHRGVHEHPVFPGADSHRRRADAVLARVLELPRLPVERHAHRHLLLRHSGGHPRLQPVARAYVAVRVVQRRVLAGGRRVPGAVKVVAHRVDPVERRGHLLDRVRPLVVAEEEARREVDGRREEEARAAGGRSLGHHRGLPLEEERAEVVHLLGVLWELPVEVEAVEAILAGDGDGGVDEGGAGGGIGG